MIESLTTIIDILKTLERPDTSINRRIDIKTDIVYDDLCADLQTKTTELITTTDITPLAAYKRLDALNGSLATYRDLYAGLSDISTQLMPQEYTDEKEA